MTVARLGEGEGQVTLLGEFQNSRNSHRQRHRNSPGTKSYWSRQTREDTGVLSQILPPGVTPPPTDTEVRTKFSWNCHLFKGRLFQNTANSQGLW